MEADEGADAASFGSGDQFLDRGPGTNIDRIERLEGCPLSASSAENPVADR